MKFIITETVLYTYEVEAADFNDALDIASDLTEADRVSQTPTDIFYSRITNFGTGESKELS